MKDYFGLYIDSTNLSNNKLISHINNCNLNCSRMSYGWPGTSSDIKNVFNYIANLPHIHKAALIIVLPDHYLNDINLNNDQLYKDCIGHCYVFYDNNRKLLTIFDVCIHQHISTSKNPPVINKLRNIDSIDSTNITYTKKDVDNQFFLYDSIDYSNKRKNSGWGSILIDAVLNTISIKFDNDILIWLCVDIENSSFEEASNLYIKYGFKNPFLTNVDPSTNSKFPNICVGLTKMNELDLPSKSEREQVFLNILYTFDQYINKLKNQPCFINIFINDITVKWLYNLISKNTIINGYLYVSKLDCKNALNSKCSIQNLNSDTFFWELTKNNIEETNCFDRIKFIMSNLNKYTCDTLVKELKDITTFYDFKSVSFSVYPYINNITRPTLNDFVSIIKNNNLCHCVVTKAGLYFISFSSDFYKDKKYIDFIKNIDMKIIESVIEKIFINYLKDITSNEEYSSRVSSIILEDIKIPLFACTYLSWNNAVQKTGVKINYQSVNNQCYTKPIVEKIINRIYTVNGVFYPNLI